MILDTNVVLQHIRRKQSISPRGILPIVVVGELQAFALKADWGAQKLLVLENIIQKLPIADIHSEIIQHYAQIDAYSQNRLKMNPLTEKTPRNMGKNDIWIAAIALFYDLELWSLDNDFDHLVSFGLKLTKKSV
ncbi:MAG: PIN domain-containing protein [Spirosomaceae bacterium]|nr:PIN domain-containing protein [Spirosomataceae bacterium]